MAFTDAEDLTVSLEPALDPSAIPSCKVDRRRVGQQSSEVSFGAFAGHHQQQCEEALRHGRSRKSKGGVTTNVTQTTL